MKEFWFDSHGAGKIHCCRWDPEGEPRAIVQIVHGIAEFVQRYADFAEYLTAHGFVVVGEDHMGHGGSIEGGSIQGYFHGGWFTALEDTLQLMENMKQEYPDIPYILFGHSMGSFMTRSILCKYPGCGIDAAIICGTGWMGGVTLRVMNTMMDLICGRMEETSPSPKVQAIAFGSYNSRIEHKRTDYDWLSRDSRVVDAYIAHPLCGFNASCGLFRDMAQGMRYNQKTENLLKMKTDLPVFFIAGGEDPVGGYGKGVEKAADEFIRVGMQDVSRRIYPLCRHEILNEINKEEIYEDILDWIRSKLK